MIAAFYDLQVSPPTWDFTKFLMRACMERGNEREPVQVVVVPGPKGGFRDDTFPPDLEMRRQMLRQVVLRYCDLLPWVTANVCATRDEAAVMLEDARREGASTLPDAYRLDAPVSTYNEALLIRAHHAGRRLPRLRALGAQDAIVARRLGAHRPVVCVLRECAYWPERNSDLAIWASFGRWLRDEKRRRVIFIRDVAQIGQDFAELETWHDATGDIALLYALMARAEMTYGVTHGTMALAWWSAVPYRTFGWWYTVNGMLPQVTQFPWAGEDQRLVWVAETFETLAASFEEREALKEVGHAAAIC
jgi:hypothetical protein